MSQSIAEYLVQDEEDANDVLNRPLFDVNMRLYRTNEHYAELVDEAIDYMEFVLDQEFDDYGVLQGISGANLGIPWNIIAYMLDGSVEVMINPKITYKSVEMTTGKSNCGSLRLSESVEVERRVFIYCEWYGPKACTSKQKKKFEGAIGRTIQHEVEHNQGILITTKGKK